MNTSYLTHLEDHLGNMVAIFFGTLTCFPVVFLSFLYEGVSNLKLSIPCCRTRTCGTA